MAEERKERVFVYGDQRWEDPGAEFTIDDVKGQLTQFFPELARAETKETNLPDGKVQVEFVKRAGTKGQLDVQEVAGRLGAVAPAVMDWRALVDELQQMRAEDRLTASAVIALQDRVDQVVAEMVDHAEKTEKVVKRCEQIAPSASLDVPDGF